MALHESSLNPSGARQRIGENLCQTNCRRMCQQDHLGRTPLHLAIIYNHKTRLHAYRDVLQQITMENDYCGAKPHLVDKFRKLFKIYDHQGDTVLHTAVKFNLLHFVKIMLKFYQKFDIKIEELEELGSGDNILHVAVRENHLEMAKIIMKLKPVLLTVKNYAGNLPLHEPNLAPNMKVLIKMSIKQRTKTGSII